MIYCGLDLKRKMYSLFSIRFFRDPPVNPQFFEVYNPNQLMDENAMLVMIEYELDQLSEDLLSSNND